MNKGVIENVAIIKQYLTQSFFLDFGKEKRRGLLVQRHSGAFGCQGRLIAAPCSCRGGSLSLIMVRSRKEATTVQGEVEEMLQERDEKIQNLEEQMQTMEFRELIKLK